MVINEFRILLDAYIHASNDGDVSTAESLMKELDGLVVSSRYDHMKTEKS
ncbi:hypothetical protein H6F75_26650 [Nodosilinea sp. FACHB-131]|nr:hypothetical protein [Nodosilinea sp. FACHB-131]MBD1877070.1 hypothetical protein [Nodosilinea sp. FACHB-131]